MSMPAGGGPQQAPMAPGNPQEKPTNDERLFAALAYLSYLVGLWFIGPLVVYGMKGRTSRFVRFHAGQALVATIAVVIGITLVGFIMIAAGFATALLHAAVDIDALSIVFVIIQILASVIFGVVPTLLLVIAGARAYGGSEKPVPIVGRFAKLMQEPLFRAVDSIVGGSSGSPPHGGTSPAAGGPPPWGGAPPGGRPPQS